MAQKNNSIEMWKRRLIAEFSRDKKKAIILGVLLLAAVFFVGKLLPGSPDAVTAAAIPPGIEVPMHPEAENVLSPSTAENPVKRVSPDRSKGITRDIFMPNASVFPLVVRETVANNKANLVDDEQDKRDEELKRKSEEIRQQAASLHLESTITGRVPIAIINGSVLGCGGVINGFRIVKIDSQVCVVEKDGVHLNLGME